ncbi:Uncharacterized conserved protein [Escherichia coli]|nr:Uncharacterized conserved protein [Escherichia coli]
MLYEDSGAMLIVKTILMREGRSWIRRYLTGGYRCYTGEKIDVYFNTAICQHSGNCVRGNGKLFNLKRKPWIMPDEVDVATVVKVIDTCPSGALKYRHK